MRIPGAIRSVYWRRCLKACNVRLWSELSIDAQRRKPSVAVVGNAGYLRDLDLGERIDSYDVVVRMNNFVTEGFERSVGRKLDLYAANFAEDVWLDNPALGQAKWVIASVPCNFHKNREQGLYFRHGIHIARGLRRMNRPEVYVPSAAYIRAMHDQLHALPTTGAMAIFLTTKALREQVGDVFITGFSFYKGRSHYYSDRTVVPKMHAPREEKALLARHLHELVTDGRVTLDPVMSEHLYARPNA